MTELAPTPALDEAAARRLTERIRITVDAINGQVEKLAGLVRQAYEGRVWTALGYATWEAYVEAEIPRVRLDRVERRELVADLASAGMSTRAIAPVVGANRKTVMSDVREVVQSGPPDVAPRTVIGLDGKTYTHQPTPPAPEPVDQPDDDPQGQIDDDDVVDAELVEPAPTPVQRPAPRRRPITDVARETGWDLRKAVERAERIVADDRFARNKEEVAAQLYSHLKYAAKTCQELLAKLPEPERNFT